MPTIPVMLPPLSSNNNSSARDDSGHSGTRISDLKPGDILLYSPTSVFGFFIRIKTWHSISHVEVFHGVVPGILDNQPVSAASRDGVGVNFYKPRLSNVCYILRPNILFDKEKADKFVQSMVGTPYGWWDLADFLDLPVDAPGIVCSPFATLDLRAGNIPIFGDEPANDVAPFEFLLAVGGLLSVFWQASKAPSKSVLEQAPK